jgi:phosphoadenosine phosphosulfate reductase
MTNEEVNTSENMFDKECIAIRRIKEYEPKEGYYVAFSGGKDSIVIYDLIKKALVKYDVHMNITTVEPPEVLQFVKTYYPEVERIKPKKSMFNLIKEKGMPPTRIIRYCCTELKEMNGVGRVVVVGVRREESVKRRNRPIFHESRKTKNLWFLNPIVDWSEKEVWEYINKYNLRYPSLYNEGYTRIGCILCPMHSIKQKLKDIERYPKYYKAYLKTFEKMLTIREKKGKPFKNYKTPEEVMHWWIYGGKRIKTTKDLNISTNLLKDNLNKMKQRNISLDIIKKELNILKSDIIEISNITNTQKIRIIKNIDSNYNYIDKEINATSKNIQITEEKFKIMLIKEFSSMTKGELIELTTLKSLGGVKT